MIPSCTIMALVCVGCTLLTYAQMAVCDETPTTPVKVAIVGSGFSGAGTAHFLNELVNVDDISVDVFDERTREHVCGRVHHRIQDGLTQEIGGSIFLESNRYMKYLANEFDLHTVSPTSKGFGMGIWKNDTDAFSFESTGWKLVDAVKLLYNFGLSNIMHLRGIIQNVINKFERLYELQSNHRSFESVDDFLKELQLYELTQRSFVDYVGGNWSDSALINDFAYALVAVNYNQDIRRMNAFASLIGLAPFASGSRVLTTEKGNSEVCRLMLRKSDTTTTVSRNSRVKKVRWLNPGYEVTVAKKFGDANHIELYDMVVIAAPLEQANIEFEGFDMPHIPRRQFKSVHVTIVRGHVRAALFKKSVDSLRGTILFARTPTGTQISVLSLWGRYDTDEGLYKMFSTQRLSNDDIGRYFTAYSMTNRVVWDAYPVFNPPEQFAPTRLHRHLFYVNTIESAASAIEISLVWSRNVALLIAKDINAGGFEGVGSVVVGGAGGDAAGASAGGDDNEKEL